MTFPFRSLLWLAAALIPATALAQAWRSTLYPENWQRPTSTTSFYNDKLIQDFSYAGYRCGEEPVPTITSPVFDVTDVTYGADKTGATDSTVAIQSAINDAGNAGGGVVYLPAGTYRISPQGANNYCLRINKSNVLLRGAGSSATFLLNTSTSMRSKTVVDVRGSVSLGGAVSITADLPGPTNRIPVATPSAFAPGDFVRIEWDFTEAWVIEHGQQSYWNATKGYPSSARYIREVMAVNDAEGWIEVDVPTRYSLKTRDNTRVSKLNGMLSAIGVESLSIGNVQHSGTGWGEEDYSVVGKAAYDVHASFLLGLSGLFDSWVSDVKSYQPSGNTTTAHMLSNGVSVINSTRLTIKDCWMGRPQYGGGGGNGYMYRLQSTNDCLLRSCTADLSRHGFVVSHAGTSGNVFLQCTDRETARALGSSSSPYTTSGSGSDNHMHFSHSNLWDQCHAHNSFYTAHHRTTSGTVPHGLTSAHAVYWNTTGSGTRYANSSNPIVRSEQARYGYVIGTRATSGTAYFASNPTGGNTAPADHLEGINSGATLFPQSLYLDQLSRRLQPTVIYQGNGATAGTAPVDASSPYAPGNTVTVLGAGSLVKTGFIFAGWNTAPDGSGTSYAAGSTFAISGSTYLYAQWFGEPYTVTFDASGGSSADPASKVVEFGSAYGLLATTSRTGYAFTGWFTAPTGGNLVTSTSTVTTGADHTLYAQWSGRPVVDAGPDQTVTVGAQMPWTPALISTRAWYDAADSISITAPGGKVSQWNDKSGNNRHATQGTADNRPTYVASDSNINNLPSIGNSILSGKIGLDTPSMTAKNVYVVSYYNTGVETTFSGYPTLFSGPGTFGTYRVMGDGNPTAPTADFISTNRFNDAGTFKNGATVSSVTALPMAASVFKFKSSAARTQVFSLGFNAATVDRNWQGSHSEWIFTDGSEDLATEQKIEGHLAHKWGLAAQLPSGHPYKNAAPVATVAIATLNGTASDPEDNTLANTWSVVSGPASVTFANASAANTTATFTTEGTYTLRLTSNDGFSTSFDEIVVTVGAQTNYTVTYGGNGATGGTPPVDANSPYAPGGNVTVSGQGDLTKTGHTFAGWNTTANGSGTHFEPDDSFTANATVTLYAQWMPITCTVSFEANGGDAPSPANMTVSYDSAYGTLAMTSRKGHSFLGWFTSATGGSLVTATTAVSTASDHTLYAQWNALPAVDAGPDQTVALDTFAPWTPAQMATAAWYDAADATTITASNGAVSRWNDKSGKGNHASQDNAAVRPTTGTTSIGSLNAISFRVGGGTNKQFLSAPNHTSLNLDSSGGVNVFSVMRYLGYVSQGSALNVPFSKGQILSANASYGIRVGDNQALAFRSGLNAQPGAGSGFLNQAIIYSGTRDDTSLKAQLHINGSPGGSVTSTTPITSDNTDPLYFGRDPSTGRYADVDFGEIIVAGGSLSADDRQKLEGYLAHKWSLAGNLPAGHLYEDTAPGNLVATASLRGSATDAEDNTLTHTWSVVSGNAAAVSFANASSMATTATFTEEGIYELRLTSSDSLGSSFDEVVITVGDVTPPNPFETWAADSGATFTGDANGDGVADGLAWLLGAEIPAENANALLPAATFQNGSLEATFKMLNQSKRGGAVMKLQHGTGLDSWTTVTIPEESGTHDGVEFVITAAGDMNEVKATIPEGSGGRLFVRLVGEPATGSTSP